MSDPRDTTPTLDRNLILRLIRAEIDNPTHLDETEHLYLMIELSSILRLQYLVEMLSKRENAHDQLRN